MRGIILFGVFVLANCATLNTADMTPACRDQYNACLNTCEATAPRMTAAYGGTTPGSTPGPNSPPLPAGTGAEPSEASCVSDCNHSAKTCNANQRAASTKPNQPY